MNFFDFSPIQPPFLIVFLTSVALAYLVGSFILYFLPPSPSISSKFPVFLRLSLGLFLPVVLWAIWNTQGNSVLFIGLLPMGFVFWKTKFQRTPNSSSPVNFSISNKVQFLLMAFIIYGLQIFFFTGFKKGVAVPPDIALYAEMTHYLGHGMENFYGNLNELNLPEYQFTTPYHYFELWMCHLVSFLFPSFSMPRILLFVVYPVLIFTFAIGIYEFVFSRIKKGWRALFLSIFALFAGAVFSDILYPIWAFLGHWQIVFETSGFVNGTGVFSHHGQKMLPIYILTLWTVVLWLMQLRLSSLAVLILIPIVNIGPAFAIFPSVFVLIFLSVVWPKNSTFPFSFLKKDGWIAVLVFASIVLFYLLTGDYFYNQKQTGNTGFLNNAVNIRGLIVGGLLRVFAAWLMVAALFSPILMLFFIKKWSQKENCWDTEPVFFFIFIAFFAGLTRAFFYGFNSGQLLSYNWPILSVIGLTFLLKTITQNALPTYLRFFAITIFTFIVVQNFVYTTSFQITMRPKPTKAQSNFDLSNQHVGILLSANTASTIAAAFSYYINGLYPVLCDQNIFKVYSLNSPTDFASPFSINGPDVRNTMGLFASLTSNNSPFAAQEFFIKKYRVSYIFVEKSAELPSYLNSAQALPHDFHPNFRLFKLQP